MSGWKNHYKFVLSAGAKVEEPRFGGAKSVTTCPETSGNNLPIVRVSKCVDIHIYYSLTV